MQVWIDGDACPKVIKEILYRMATRTKTSLIVVSNHAVSIPPSPFIKRIQVGSGFDVVDIYITDNISPSDLVITADIPFADSVITRGGFALNPRGEFYSENNIKQRLGSRNANETLRASGMISGGPSKYSPKDIQKFANTLDAWITQNR